MEGKVKALFFSHDANGGYAMSEYDDGRQGLGAFSLNKQE